MSRLSIILALGTAQTLAWASSYYLLAIIADAIARDLHITATAVFAAFSASLVLSALAGPRVGRTIDRFGGREVLAVSNVLFAGGLALLAVSQSMAVFGLAWLVIGIAMGLGLYDAAFAALTRIYGSSARGAMTGITLLAGFASTIGWPLTSWALEAYGWRTACFGWAGAHFVVGLPLNLFVLPKQRRAAVDETQPGMKPQIPMDATMCSGLRLCRRLGRLDRNGGSSSANPTRRRNATRPGDYGGGPRRPRSGCRQSGRSKPASPSSPLPFGTSLHAGPPGGKLAAPCRRRCHGHAIHAAARCRKRHLDDRQRHGSARSFWTRELRLSAWSAWGSGPACAGCGAARLRAAY